MTNPIPNHCPTCGSPIAEGAPQGLCPKCVLSQAATVPDAAEGRRRKSPPPTRAELAAHFPDLEILDLIGCGGMGAVYQARQPKLDRLVALKILSHELGADPAFAERFQREARVLARLHHPHIVTVFDTGTAGPYAYLLMEYVDGVNLRQAMRTGGFSAMESLALVQEICAALKFAHEKGVLHRDIKPENVLLDSGGSVKIADFGIAKLIGLEEPDDQTLTYEGSILGSPSYMAPEQIESPGDIDQRADLYSLGVVLYELLTGELPLGRFALPSEKRPIDVRIDEIVLRTLAKEREARYQTAGEIQTDVAAFSRSGGEGPLPKRSHDPESTRATSRSAKRFALIAGLGLLLCAGTYYLWKTAGNVLQPMEESASRSGGVSGPDWRNGQPELNVDLAVAPGLVATMEFVRTDNSGEAQEVPDHLDVPAAYVIAPDTESWRGTFVFGSLEGGPVSYGPRWMLEMGGSSTDYSHVGTWDFDLDGPVRLELSSPGVHRFHLATGRSNRDLPGNLVLQVTGVKRSTPGIPAELREGPTGDVSVVAVGEAKKLDWIQGLRRAIELKARVDAVSSPGSNPTTRTP